MLVRDFDDYLEVAVAEREIIPQAAGDTCFAVRVRVSGMFAVLTAESSCWVDLRALVAFAEQLKALEERRQGAA